MPLGGWMRSVHKKEYRDFLAKLRKARLAVGYTQMEVAKKLKKPQSYVSKFECGERRLDLIEVREIASIYGKKLEYFED